MKISVNFIALLLVVACIQSFVGGNIIVMPEAMYMNTSPTAKVDNYILQHQRQFEEQMRSLDKYLEDFRKKFELRLEVIEYYDDVTDSKLRDLNDKLNPLEMLGDISEMCVEKYRSKLPSDIGLRANLKACTNKASTAFSSLINNPENTLKNIRNHYNNQFNNAIKECKKKFEKDEVKYRSCATTAIANSNTYFNTNTNTFYTQMTVAECGSNTKISEAFACYSQNVYQTFSIMGEVNGLIENCLAGYDFCALCNKNGVSNNVKGRCPYQMAWNLDDDDLVDDVIINPFKGVNSTTPCLRVNFITKPFSNSVNKE